MPNIIQQEVMNQTGGPYGAQSCGYHTLKNALLTFLFYHDHLNQETYNARLKDQHFFAQVLESPPFSIAQPDEANPNIVDITVVDMIERLKNCDQVFPEPFGIAQPEHLGEKIAKDISVALLPFWVGGKYGTTEMEQDLSNAAKIARLSQTKGATQHIFAIGLMEHWVCASFQQDEHGIRTWHFMDSYRNQTIHQSAVIQKLEEVLNQTPPELAAYLIEVYRASSDLFNRRYHLFFNDSGVATQEKIPGFGPNGDQAVNARDFYIQNPENAREFCALIKNRFEFMEQVGWLKSSGLEESKYRQELYHLTRFMFENMDKSLEHSDEILNELRPIYLKFCEVYQVSSDQISETPDFTKQKEDELENFKKIQEQHNAILLSYENEPDIRLIKELKPLSEQSTPYFERLIATSAILTILNRKAKKAKRTYFEYVQWVEQEHSNTTNKQDSPEPEQKNPEKAQEQPPPLDKKNNPELEQNKLIEEQAKNSIHAVEEQKPNPFIRFFKFIGQTIRSIWNKVWHGISSLFSSNKEP